MKLFLSVEGQKCVEIGLSHILAEMQNKLSFISSQDNLSSTKYGTEFVSISIIPTCVSDEVWYTLGWKERILLRRKNREADIRLRINYEQFINADEKCKRAMFIDILVKSIRAIQERAKGDFNGEAMIEDILLAVQ